MEAAPRQLRYNWDDIIYFLEVARTRNLVRAGQKLKVTIKLSSKARALVKKHKKVKSRLLVTARDTAVRSAFSRLKKANIPHNVDGLPWCRATIAPQARSSICE